MLSTEIVSIWDSVLTEADCLALTSVNPLLVVVGVSPGNSPRVDGGDAVSIERLPEPRPGSFAACFLMTRRGASL